MGIITIYNVLLLYSRVIKDFVKIKWNLNLRSSSFLEYATPFRKDENVAIDWKLMFFKQKE